MLGRTTKTTLQNVMGSISASVDNHESKVVTARQPSSAYVTLSSRDRYFNASPTQRQAVFQPWNSFILQKAEALIPSYTRRLAITEVRFPWSIPNITENNAQFVMILNDAEQTTRIITIDSDVFLTPAQIVVALNEAIVDAFDGITTVPLVSYKNGGFIFLADGVNFALVPILLIESADPEFPINQSFVVSSSLNFLNAPNLLSTLGVPFDTLTTILSAPVFQSVLICNSSLGLYTDYVDITSEKLMRFADARDAGSGSLLQTSTICRLYLADEVSLTTLDTGGQPVPVGCAPFVIHRQFKTPKQVLCSPDSFVGDLDIQVYDMFGKLVYLKQGSSTPRPLSYPDFQITMLASEN